MTRWAALAPDLRWFMSAQHMDPAEAVQEDDFFTLPIGGPWWLAGAPALPAKP